DPNDVLRYEIAGGADASKFDIDPVSGLLSFKASAFTGGAPNAGAPTDADGDGRYQVTVRVKDYTSGLTWKGGSDTQDLTVTVTATPDTTAPTLDLRSGISPADNATGIAPNSNFFLNFSEAVQPGSGFIYIRNATTGAVVQ